MSFKREGDDGSQLNLLKKRRVAELLAKYIPDDEAVLMSNGRYACTVCHYKPVFDTVDMLSVHRAGRKHQHATEHHFAKKKELALLVQKRRIENEVKKQQGSDCHEVEEPSPLLKKVEVAKRHTLLKEAPYNPCHTHKTDGPSKKSKNKLFFQGIRQTNLKAFSGNSSNYITQNSNSANEERALLHHPDKPYNDSMGAQKTRAPAFSNISQCKTKTSPAAVDRNTERRPVYKSTSQTPTPGVPSIEIKPYIPKAKRIAMNLKACSSKQTGPESKEERHQSTSSPANRKQSSLSMQSQLHGEEVDCSGIEFISEFQNTENMEGNSRPVCPEDETVIPVLQAQKQRELRTTRITLNVHDLKFRRLKDVRSSKEMQSEMTDGRMVNIDDREKEGVEESWKDALGPGPKGHCEIVPKQSGLSVDASTNPGQDVKGFPLWSQRTSQRDERGFPQWKAGVSYKGDTVIWQCRGGPRMDGERPSKGKQKTELQAKPKMSAERRRELQRHLELTSAGWIQDNNGQWIKDEDVEFDSDEEPPAP